MDFDCRPERGLIGAVVSIFEHWGEGAVHEHERNGSGCRTYKGTIASSKCVDAFDAEKGEVVGGQFGVEARALVDEIGSHCSLDEPEAGWSLYRSQVDIMQVDWVKCQSDQGVKERLLLAIST